VRAIHKKFLDDERAYRKKQAQDKIKRNQNLSVLAADLGLDTESYYYELSNKPRIMPNRYHFNASDLERKLRPRSIIKLPEDYQVLVEAEKRREAEGAPPSFHITDLLKKEERRKEKPSDSEYVIKNYRLI